MRPETTDTATAPPRVFGALEHLELARLDPHPLNPRARMTAASLANLVASIQELGVLEPLLVRPADPAGQDVQPPEARRYQVVSGHRRLEALRAVHPPEWGAPCIVRAMTDAEALEALLTGNEHREEVDPLREAAAVAALLELLGGDVVLVGERLGKGFRWVAARRALLNLSPTWRERLGREPWRSWPVAILEALARLAPDAQDAFTEAHRWELVERQEDPAAEAVPPTLRWTLDAVAAYTRELKRATWDLADPDLVVAAGACTTCPKTSNACPGLFDDGQPVDLKAAKCLDATCWARKVSAHLDREHAKLEEKLGTKVVRVVTERGLGDEQGHLTSDPRRAEATKGALEPWQYDKAKKGDKGAVPAQVVSGKGTAVTWVKLRRGRPASRPENVGKRPVPTLKELEASYAQQVLEEADQEVRLAVQDKKLDPPPLRVLQASMVVGMLPYHPTDAAKRRKAAKAMEGRSVDELLEAWTGTAWRMVQEATHDAEADDVAHVAELLGVDVKAARAAAAERVKPAKALLAARAAKAKPKKEPKAKKGPAPKKGRKPKKDLPPITGAELEELLGVVVPDGGPNGEDLDLFTQAERDEVQAWAGAVHLRAGDHDDVAVPAAPASLVGWYENRGKPFPAPKAAKPPATYEQGELEDAAPAPAKKARKGQAAMADGTPIPGRIRRKAGGGAEASPRAKRVKVPKGAGEVPTQDEGDEEP